jgi:phenylacetate-coenzyme A ligase PaaK-like adenylate-forming protein
MKAFSAKETWIWLKTLWDRSRNLRRSRAEIQASHQKKFRKLVAFAKERSPFYRAIIAERGIDPEHCSIEDFPVLAKKEVIDNFDQIVTDSRISRARIADFLSHSSDPNELFEGQFHVLHTSGTSGTMGYYVFSHHEWINGSSHIARVVRPGRRKRIAYVAATRGHFAGVSLSLTGNQGLRRFLYEIVPFDVGIPVPQIIRELNEFQPHVLSGYAAMMKVLAESQEAGLLRIKPRQITSGGEMLTQENKSYIERVFNAKVINAYASSEHLYMGLTLPGSDGLHLLEDDLIFELQQDHTCITNLFNYTMPLIRYRINDVLVPDLRQSKYPFLRVREVVGRYEDALVFTNRFGQREFIHPIVIVELMVPGLRSWQIQLIDSTSFVFRARFEPDLGETEKRLAHTRIREKMQSILAEKDMQNVTFDVEERDEIPVDPQTGKFRLVVRPASRQMDAAA